MASDLLDWMRGAYGARFMDQWRGVDPEIVLRAWADGLRGYRPSEVAAGIEACKTRPFAPTLPEFLALCRPVLSPEAGFHAAADALRSRYRHEPEQWPSVAHFHAAAGLGTESMSLPWERIRARWEWALQRAQEGVAAGRLAAEVPVLPLALPDMTKPVPAPAGVREKLAGLVEQMRIGKGAGHAAG